MGLSVDADADVDVGLNCDFATSYEDRDGYILVLERLV
jgi:hypothetical protein